MSWSLACNLARSVAEIHRAQEMREGVTQEDITHLLEGLACLDQTALAAWKSQLVAEELDRFAESCAWNAREDVTVKTGPQE